MAKIKKNKYALFNQAITVVEFLGCDTVKHNIINTIDFKELLFFIKLCEAETYTVGHCSVLQRISLALQTLGIKYGSEDVTDIAMALLDFGYIKFLNKTTGFFHSLEEAMGCLLHMDDSTFTFKLPEHVKCPYSFKLKKIVPKPGKWTFKKRKNSAVYIINRK